VPVCGVIAHYNGGVHAHGPDRLAQTMTAVLQKRIRMQGFIVLDHYGERFETFSREMGQWVAEGRVKLHEDVVDGLENAPAAFIGLLEGQNLGKRVVRVAAA
jgi:NADPH-dependent curcumin reductase CurA